MKSSDGFFSHSVTETFQFAMIDCWRWLSQVKVFNHFEGVVANRNVRHVASESGKVDKVGVYTDCLIFLSG